jgi:hypothetical protein
VGKIAELMEEPWAEWIDWEKYGRGCDVQVDYTNSLIDGVHFNAQLDDVIRAARSKLAPE